MARRPIRTKWLSNCSGVELQQLNRLRFKGDSMMYDDVICATSYREKIRIFMVEEEGRIVGWSSVLLPGAGNKFLIPENSKYAPIYTYINRTYRGLGLGKRLLRRSYNFIGSLKMRPTVFYWDVSSTLFFEALKKKVAPKLIIMDAKDWWDIYG